MHNGRLRTTRLELAVGSADLEDAERYYRELFALARPPTRETRADGSRRVTLRGGTILDIVAGPVSATRFYERGVTPRLELRVLDLEDWIAAFVERGATVRARVPSEGPTTYAHVIDRYGHLWALAAVEARLEGSR